MRSTSLGFRSAVLDKVAGSLTLSVARQGQRTRPVTTEGRGVLKVLRPLYLDDSGQVTYIIVNPGGAYFGETYHVNVEVQEGAHLLLASQGATRIYKTPVRPAEQRMTVTLHPGSRIEYVPDQVIAYRDARYRQFTQIVAAPDAQGFFGEIVTPGWDPNDVRFTYAGMHLRLSLHNMDGMGLVCVDNVRIEPGQLVHALHGPGGLEGMTHMGSLLIFGPHTTGDYLHHVREIIRMHGPAKTGATAGTRHGLSWVMVRALGNSTDELYQLLRAVNAYDRSVTTGQDVLDLRRY